MIVPNRARRWWRSIGIVVLLLAGALTASAFNPAAPATVSRPGQRLDPTDPNPSHRYTVTPVAEFDEAWAMSFLPGSSLALITERPGRLILRNMATGATQLVAGVPAVAVGGQGGLGDVIPDAGYNGSVNRTIYLSWVEAGNGNTRGAVVGRATLSLNNGGAPQLNGLTTIWRQAPKTSGLGHFAGRLTISPDGRYLFITSGDRQLMAPAQDPTSDLGKIIRYDLAAGVAERWTMGHRNPLGVAFAPDGRLWSSEMGPKGGDELNHIVRGRNYGWPNVSNGSHYDGTDVPDHQAGDGYEAPAAWWTPSISPGSLMIYRGVAFPHWYGDAFLGALSGRSLVRLQLDGNSAAKAEAWPMSARIRVVTEDPRDGTIWLIEDGANGRLLHLTPA